MYNIILEFLVQSPNNTFFPVPINSVQRLSPVPGSKRAKVVCGDDDYKDPQLCAEYAFDIYDHLRIAEVYYLLQEISNLFRIT